MLQESILQYFRPSLELLLVLKTFVLSVFEWSFKTGLTVNIITLRSKSRLQHTSFVARPHRAVVSESDMSRDR